MKTLLVLLLLCCTLLAHVLSDATYSNPGYSPQFDIGTEDALNGPSFNMIFAGESKYIEIATAFRTGDSDPMTVVARLENRSNVTFDVTADKTTFTDKLLYKIHADNTVDESDRIIVNLQTNRARITVYPSFVNEDYTFNATKPEGIVSRAQFFLGIITYPFMALYIFVLIVLSTTYYCIKERKKDNTAPLSELTPKRTKALLLFLLGLLLAFIAVAFVIVVPFFTKRDTQDVCCVYVKRVSQYAGSDARLAQQSYSTNCERTGTDNDKVRSATRSCYADQVFFVKYSANIWWWLILVGSVPGVVLYFLAHAIMTVAAYKGIRLLKPQRRSKGETKFSVGIQE